MQQALYRKYRPEKLTELVGQEEAVSLISQQIKNNNLEKYVEDEYRGAAKNPDKLADPSDDALNELEKLLEKY